MCILYRNNMVRSDFIYEYYKRSLCSFYAKQQIAFGLYNNKHSTFSRIQYTIQNTYIEIPTLDVIYYIIVYNIYRVILKNYIYCHRETKYSPTNTSWLSCFGERPSLV